jgi:pyruvate formate lyase activating enzyme
MTQDYMDIRAPVFNIQSYSIHDGPGIRVTVFIKGCPLSCLWCANPESKHPGPQLMTYRSRCTGCARCLPVCPKGAVTMAQSDGKPYAETDRDLCDNCGSCVPACPSGAREISGEEMTVRQVLDRVLADKLFLDDSGGGMTISGGECLLYPDFTEALLCAAKQAGVHTAVETSCFSGRDTIDRIFRYVDLGLPDVKHMDSAVHKKLTGVPNRQILDNIVHIRSDLNVPVNIRVPVIPGCNDSDENITATALFTADKLGPETPIHLLPYHRQGESKNESLGKKMDLSIEPPSDEHMERLKSLAEKYVRNVQIGG